jgi:hypothetical protein
MRSRRARVALAATIASATASAIGRHGVSSDGSGDCANVSGSGSPCDE